MSVSIFTETITELIALENCTKDNFPLVFSDVELVVRESEANYDFLRRFLPKLEWSALVETAQSVSCPAPICGKGV